MISSDTKHSDTTYDPKKHAERLKQKHMQKQQQLELLRQTGLESKDVSKDVSSSSLNVVERPLPSSRSFVAPPSNSWISAMTSVDKMEQLFTDLSQKSGTNEDNSSDDVIWLDAKDIKSSQPKVTDLTLSTDTDDVKEPVSIDAAWEIFHEMQSRDIQPIANSRPVNRRLILAAQERKRQMAPQIALERQKDRMQPHQVAMLDDPDTDREHEPQNHHEPVDEMKMKHEEVVEESEAAKQIIEIEDPLDAAAQLDIESWDCPSPSDDIPMLDEPEVIFDGKQMADQLQVSEIVPAAMYDRFMVQVNRVEEQDRRRRHRMAAERMSLGKPANRDANANAMNESRQRSSTFRRRMRRRLVLENRLMEQQAMMFQEEAPNSNTSAAFAGHVESLHHW